MLVDPIQNMDSLSLEVVTTKTRSLPLDDILEYSESFKTIKENLYQLEIQQQDIYERKIKSEFWIKKLTREQEEASMKIGSYRFLQEANLKVQREVRKNNENIKLKVGVGESSIYTLEFKL